MAHIIDQEMNDSTASDDNASTQVYQHRTINDHDADELMKKQLKALAVASYNASKSRRRSLSDRDDDDEMEERSRISSRMKSSIIRVSSPSSSGHRHHRDERHRRSTKSPEKAMLLNSLVDLMESKRDSASKDRVTLVDDDRSLRTIKSFKELNISARLLKALNRMYIEKPRGLESVLLPQLFDHKSKTIFVRSRAQSGKKTTFLINAVQRVDTSLSDVQAIILVPTAELCLYINESAKRMSKYRGVRVDYMIKDSNLRNSVQLLISTPGSLLECLEGSSKVDKAAIKLLIVDELELQLSSSDNIRKLTKVIAYLKSTKCQFQFYCNCFGDNALQFVREHVSSSPIVLEFLKPQCFKLFNQFSIYSRSEKDKYKGLVKLLRATRPAKVLIYVARMSYATYVYEDLRDEGFRNVMCLSSKSKVEERLQVNNEFNSSKQAILVLNYPLLLGINLDDLSMVVNFNLPNGKPSYLFHEYFHKISRCSPQKTGFVFNCIDDDTHESASRLEEYFDFKMIELDIGSLSWRDINAI